jgi:D-aminopeptidase
MKVCISGDMQGVSGVVDGNQADNEQRKYARAWCVMVAQAILAE